MIDLAKATVRAIGVLVRDRQVSAVEVIRAVHERIERYEPAVNAFVTVLREESLEAARKVDRDVAAGKSLPLAGVPIAVKDSFDVEGVKTTAGSKVLDKVASEDATAVARLKAAGCVVVGKASLHEFAFGFTNQNPHHGDCKNPWDTTRIPGGSCGGNAVALACSCALGAIGGDTGGSIRLPAALCGVAGLKVTYGRVSRYGGVPLSWSIDTVGPMARNVGDLAVLLQAMAGADPRDPASSPKRVPDYTEAARGADLQGVRIGIPHRHFFEVLEPDVGATLQDALQIFKGLGATLVDVDFPPIDPVVGAHRTILFSEAAAAHDALVRERGADISDDVRNMLQAGHFFSAPQYLAAQQARRKLIADYRRLWKAFDVLITPTSPVAAPPIGASSVSLGGQDRPLVRVFLDHTLPFNLTGQPALAIPCGFTSKTLPVGLQLVGRPFEEGTLLRLGAAFESATTWHEKRPALDRLKTS